MPKLQSINGCHADAERPTEIGGLDFYRCPRTLVEERELRVLGLVGEGYLEALTPRERRLLPAKLFASLQYVAGLATAPKGGVVDAD